MRAHLVLAACLLASACAAAVTADDLDVDDPGPPAPVDPPITPHAVAPEAPPTPPSPNTETTAEAHACIDDMLEDARGRGLVDGIWSAPEVTVDELSVRRLTDVDGDGEDEWLVTRSCMACGIRLVAAARPGQPCGAGACGATRSR